MHALGTALAGIIGLVITARASTPVGDYRLELRGLASPPRRAAS